MFNFAIAGSHAPGLAGSSRHEKVTRSRSLRRKNGRLLHDHSHIIAAAMLAFTLAGASTASADTFIFQTQSNSKKNTGDGTSALLANTTGFQNTAQGLDALRFNTSGFNNTAIGAYALRSNTYGSHNTATGISALLANTYGFQNTATGAEALRFNSTGSNNTATGRSALYANITGSENTATGMEALALNLSGNGNTAVGAYALRSNTGGSYNTATGISALFANTTGDQNTATGYDALRYNTTGYANSAIGSGALYQNATGSYNTASGRGALANNTAGDYNTASGDKTLLSNTTGSSNTAYGREALASNTWGNYNTASGEQALHNNTIGSNNIGLGFQAGHNVTSGSDNIHIGNTGLNESTTTRLGTVQTRAFIAGIRGRTTGYANAVPVVIDSEGQLGTISSSARFKEDINDMAGYSGRLYDLRPVTYRYKEPATDGSKPLEPGLIAEEVAEVYPDLVAYGADGKIETVQYHKLTPMLLNELHQLQKTLKTQMVRNVALETEVRDLEGALVEARRTHDVLVEQDATIGDRLAKLERASMMLVTQKVAVD